MDLHNDDIDMNKLEIELETAIAKDEKYQRENDAKFRAVHQKVSSYDEFRDIVLASHLRPLDKKDISGGMKYQAWNTVASSKSQATSDVNMNKTSDSWEIPKTSAEFDKIWKHYCISPEQKFDLLLKVGSTRLKDLVKIECPLGEIISAIKSSVSYSANSEIVLDILEVITHAKRFSLSLDFLDNNEKRDLDYILASCKSEIEKSVNTSDFEKYDSICKKYKSS